MEAIIFFLAVLLIIAVRLAWFQTGRVVDLRKANDRARPKSAHWKRGCWR